MQESFSKIPPYMKSLLIGTLIGLGITAVFAAGFLFRGAIDLQRASAASSINEYRLLNEVQELIDRHYLRQQPEFKEREYSAIRGMLTTLNDRYTFFVDPPVAQSESDVLAGTYGGVGVQVKRSENGDLIMYPFVDSPAKSVGIVDGDILVAINNVVVEVDQQVDAVDQMLRGEVKEGNGVILTFRKSQSQDEENIFVPFAVINVPSVIWRTIASHPEFGYIQILIFTSRTPEELKLALQDLLSKDISGLILDLRNNSGGLLQESVAVASQFLDGGIIVYEKSNLTEQELVAEEGGLATYVPLVVLVNQGTASAAELVAGAIRDRERGILIGQTTFGKGTVQRIYRLSDESSLHITSAEWLTPNHLQLEEEGLEPTIAMIPDPNGRDIELGEALRYLEQNYLQAQGS